MHVDSSEMCAFLTTDVKFHFAISYSFGLVLVILVLVLCRYGLLFCKICIAVIKLRKYTVLLCSLKMLDLLCWTKTWKTLCFFMLEILCSPNAIQFNISTFGRWHAIYTKNYIFCHYNSPLELLWHLHLQFAIYIVNCCKWCHSELNVIICISFKQLFNQKPVFPCLDFIHVGFMRSFDYYKHGAQLKWIRF